MGEQTFYAEVIILLKEIRDILRKIEQNTAPPPLSRWTVGTPFYNDGSYAPSTGKPLPNPPEIVS